MRMGSRRRRGARPARTRGSWWAGPRQAGPRQAGPAWAVPRARALAPAVVCALALALALAACGQLPTSGPVREGSTALPDAGTVQVDAARPVPGDSPLEIVQGFLAAGAAGSSTDVDFEVARSFLTPEAAATWSPLTEVVVTANDEPQTYALALAQDGGAGGDADGGDGAAGGSGGGEAAEGGSDGGPEVGEGVPELTSADLRDAERVLVSVRLVAVGDVSGDGVFTSALSRTRSERTYELVREGSEWRIEVVPAGLVLTEVTFGLVFRAVPLQFVTPDGSTLVPDIRYVPVRNAASHAVDLLLGGPAGWLAPAVVTRVAPGLAVEPGRGVAVDDAGVAQVRLVGQDVPESQREELYAQVRGTLLGVGGVRDVSLWLGGAPYEPVRTSELPQVRESVPPVLVAVREGELVTVLEGEVVPYVQAVGGTTAGGAASGESAAPEGGDAGDGAAAGQPQDAATGDDGAVADPSDANGDAGAAEATASASGGDVPRGLSDPSPAYDPSDGVAALRGGELVSVTSDGVVSPLAELRDPVPPSQDRYGYVWAGERSGEVIVAAPGEVALALPSPFEDQEGSALLALRVSRDGARAVAMVQDDVRVRVVVCAVVREESGRPTGLLPGPTLLALAGGEDLAWADGATVMVLGATSAQASLTVRALTVGGPATPLAAVAQAASITAGNGPTQVYLATSEGRLLARSSLRWEEVAADVSDPAFPG